MNAPATVEGSEGLLKDNYGRSPLEEALRKKRRAMAETKGMELKEEEQDNAL